MSRIITYHMCSEKLVANRIINFREGTFAMNVGKAPSECSNLFPLAGGGDGETEDDSASDYEWNKDNQGGEEWTDLDSSVTVVNSNGARVDSPGQGPSRASDQGQTQMVQLQHVQQFVDNAMKAAWPNMGQENYQHGGEKVTSCLEKITEILQNQMKCKQEELDMQKEKLESRKRREADGPAVLEDEVKVVEKTLTIKDDSNGVIDIQARATLGRNPNSDPSCWIGGDKVWPRIARPAVGALLNMRHIMPSYIGK